MVEPQASREISRWASDGKSTQPDMTVRGGLHSAGSALLPSLGCSSGSRRAHTVVGFLLLALLTDSGVRHFPRSQSNTGLCAIDSASLECPNHSASLPFPPLHLFASCCACLGEAPDAERLSVHKTLLKLWKAWFYRGGGACL